MAEINQNKPGYKKTKVGWIPNDWKVYRIEEITGIKVGRDLKEENFSPTKDEEFSYPVYSNTVDNKGLYGFYNFAEYNGESLTIVGRGVGLGTAFYRNEGFGAVGRLLVLFPKQKADAAFLNYFVNGRMRFFVESSGIPQLTGAQVSKYKIPLPPLPEQRRIAAILSTWDAAIAKLDALIAKKQELKKGLMQQLLTGQVRFPEFVPTGGTRYKETKVGRVPEEWEVVKMRNIFEFLSTTSYSRSKLTYDETERGIFYIHYGDIHTIYKRPVINVSSTNDVPQLQGGIKLPRNPTFLKDGDLIIADASEDYDGVGECIELQLAGSTKAISGLHTFALRDKQNKTAKGFRSYILRNPNVRNALRRIATGSKVFGISKSNLLKFEVVLPPLPEQYRLAEVLTLCDKEISKMEIEKEHLLLQKKGLMQQLLTGAVRVRSKPNPVLNEM